MENSKKVSITSIIFYIVGSLFILGGILFCILPGFISPSYYLVKNNTNLMNDYINDNDKTIYTYTYSYLLDKNYFGDVVNDNQNNSNIKEIEINLNGIYKDNNEIFVDNNSLFKLYVAIEVLDYENRVNDGLTPLFDITAKTEFDKTILKTSISENKTYFYLGDLNYDLSSSKYTHVSVSGNVSVYEYPININLSYRIADVYVLFFKEA